MFPDHDWVGFNGMRQFCFIHISSTALVTIVLIFIGNSPEENGGKCKNSFDCNTVLEHYGPGSKRFTETTNLAGSSEPGTLIRGQSHLWVMAAGSEG